MAGRAASFSLFLAVSALAGCLGGADDPERSSARDEALLEPVLHALGSVVNLSIPLPDGLAAHGTVYLPDVAGGTRVPVVMDLGPYYGNLGPETYAYDRDLPPDSQYFYLLQRGYAIALVSLRGTGLSEGCFKIGGAEEQRDAAAIVEWLASQPWSDGTVAMTGVSYDGTTPWEAAVTGTPSLKAIVPVEGISDMYRYMYFEGVPIWNGGGYTFNTYYTALVDTQYDPLAGGGVDGARAWLGAQGTNVCPETAEVVLAPYQTWRDGVHGPFWDERDTSAMLERATAATLVVHGFQDWNVKPDNVQFLWDELRGPKRMVLGQWQHVLPWENGLNRDWDYAHYNATLLQWFDAFVRGDEDARAAALAAPPVVAQDTAGRWWNLTAWPPAESVARDLHLAEHGGHARLLAEPQNKTFAYSFDAQMVRGRATPVRTGDGAVLPVAPGGASSVTFESHTLRAPLHLMGNPQAVFTISVSHPAGYLNAWLYDVDPLGAATLITPGFQNLATRGSRDRASDVPVEEEMTVPVKMFAVNHVLHPGHRLRLRLDSYDPTSGFVATLPTPAPTQFTVHLGEGRENLLRLPVFAGALPPTVG